MRKRDIINQLKKIMETMDRQQLQNLLDSWSGLTPKLWGENNNDEQIRRAIPY